MKKIQYKIFNTILVFTLMFVISCADDPAPTLMDIPAGGLPAPVINSIEPANVALAGVTVLTITGSNFAPGADSVSVTFNGVKGTILSVTTNEIKVRAANAPADSVEIKVASYKSENFSNIINYKLLPPLAEIYKFDPSKDETPNAITVDAQENVYVSLSSKGTKKIDPQGNISDFATGTTATAFFTSMTFASDNSIYAVKRIKGVYKVSENAGPAAFISSAQGVTDNINSINFDKTRNVLWAGGNTGIVYRITLDKSVKKFNINGNINSVKVVQNNLFIASTSDNKEVIWKVPIFSADSLGLPELYFDVTSEIDSVIKIVDIVYAQDGDLYIGTNKDADPIFVIHPDFSFESFYPGIINSSVFSLVWGNENFVYMTNTIASINKTIFKIDMQKLGTQ